MNWGTMNGSKLGWSRGVLVEAEPRRFLGLEATILVVAVTMDRVAEWRAHRGRGDLVSAWPVHRVQMVDLAVAALRSAGIAVHARGRYHRALLFFFGPFIPVERMVPREQVAGAQDVLRPLLAAPEPS